MGTQLQVTLKPGVPTHTLHARCPVSEACPRAWHLNESQEENQAVAEPRKFAECSRVSRRKGGWEELARWKPSHRIRPSRGGLGMCAWVEDGLLGGGSPPTPQSPCAWMLAALSGFCFVLFAQTFSCIILQSRCSSLKFSIATFPNRSEVLEQEGKLYPVQELCTSDQRENSE